MLDQTFVHQFVSRRATLPISALGSLEPRDCITDISRFGGVAEPVQEPCGIFLWVEVQPLTKRKAIENQFHLSLCQEIEIYQQNRDVDRFDVTCQGRGHDSLQLTNEPVLFRFRDSEKMVLDCAGVIAPDVTECARAKRDKIKVQRQDHPIGNQARANRVCNLRDGLIGGIKWTVAICRKTRFRLVRGPMPRPSALF